MTGAMRFEDYTAFGTVATPKVGGIYSPSKDVELKASWGRSFKAPTLAQQYGGAYALLYPAADLGASGYPSNATALFVEGGNQELKPERATTWAATFAYHPVAVPGLRTELSYFNILYKNRVLSPIATTSASFTNPAYQQFLSYNPTAAQQQQAIDQGTLGFYNFTAGAYDPANVVAVVNDLYTNVAYQEIHGIDLSALYNFELGSGSLTLSDDTSWIESRQKNGNSAPWFNLAGTVYNPPHFRSRTGISWSRGALIVSVFYNYVGDVEDVISVPNVKGDAMQTVDFTALYNIDSSSYALRDVDLSLSVRNLGNQRPPYLKNLYDNFVNYDFDELLGDRAICVVFGHQTLVAGSWDKQKSRLHKLCTEGRPTYVDRSFECSGKHP